MTTIEHANDADPLGGISLIEQYSGLSVPSGTLGDAGARVRDGAAELAVSTSSAIDRAGAIVRGTVVGFSGTVDDAIHTVKVVATVIASLIALGLIAWLVIGMSSGANAVAAVVT